MAKTYKLELFASGPYSGCDSTDIIDLHEYGYTDEEWDGLTARERESFLYEWGKDYFWSEGFEFSAEVKRG